MEGIISCVKHSTSNSYIVVMTNQGKVAGREFKNKLLFNAGETVLTDGMEISPKDGEKESSLEKLQQELEKTIEGCLVESPYLSGIKEIDEGTGRMWKRLSAASRLLLRKIILGQPVLIRFHNDADGSSGAVGVYRALGELLGKIDASPNLVWIMHKGVHYTRRDAESDKLISANYSTIEKPLLLIIDFGTSQGSNEGIEAAEKSFDIIWLDHHPIEKDFAGTRLENYINPWSFGSESGYTAGLLACIFSKTFSRTDTKELESASMIGDYSRFALPDKAGEEAAMILDLVTSDPKILSNSDSNITPAEIEVGLRNPEKRAELYDYARMRLDDTMDMALREIKQSKAEKADIFTLNYGELRSADSKYPLPGRFASRLLTSLEEQQEKPCVAIVHFNSYISMRVGDKVSDAVNLPEVIAEMKEMHSEMIESGGGHKNAASIKVRFEENKKEVLRSLTELIKSRLERETRSAG